MFSLVLCEILKLDVNEIIGYIAMAVELFLILIRCLMYFFPEDTKFGRFLRHIFKGFKGVSSEIKNVSDTINKKEVVKDVEKTIDEDDVSNG